jgi:undecaprenyl-diphosphatase
VIGAVAALDASLREVVLSLRGVAVIDAGMAALSEVGRAGMVWLVLALALTLARRAFWPVGWRTLLAVIISLSTVDFIVKPLVQRPRPAGPPAPSLVQALPSWSFPSGHAASSFAAATVLTRGLERGRAAVWALAALIALSRVWVGVHYPLDVIAGALLGVAVGVWVEGGWRPRRGPVRAVV